MKSFGMFLFGAAGIVAAYVHIYKPMVAHRSGASIELSTPAPAREIVIAEHKGTTFEERWQGPEATATPTKTRH